MKLWIIILVLVIIFLIPLCVVSLIETRLYKISYTDLLERVLEDEIVLKDKNEEIERLKKIIEFRNVLGAVLLNKIEKNSEIKL